MFRQPLRCAWRTEGVSEAVAFGTRCGKALLGDAALPCSGFQFDISADRLLDRRFGSVFPCDRIKPPATLKALGDVLWSKAGIIRTENGLNQALEFVDRILAWNSVDGANSGLDPRKKWALRAAALTSRAIIISALGRTESRGAHFREDYPEESASWELNIHTAVNGSGVPEIIRGETIT